MSGSPAHLLATSRRHRLRAFLAYLAALVAMAGLLSAFLLDQYRQDVRAAYERTMARADLTAEWISSALDGGEAAATDDVFARTLDRLRMTRGESLTIIDTDLTLVARRPAFGGDEPGAARGMTVTSPLTQAFIESGEASTRFRTESPLDGRERLYTLRRVDDAPFVVVVGEEVETALAGWGLRVWVLAGVVLLLALLGGLVLRHYLGRLRLEAALRERLAEREEARREAQEGEARLRALLDSIQDMLFVLDGDGHYVFVHAVDAERLLRSPERVLGRHYREVLPPDLAEQHARAIAEVGETGRPTEFEYRLELAGESLDFLAILSPLSGDGVLVVVRDITDARATEAQLRIAATAFETHLGMLITDAEGRILKVNDTFSRITGYREDEVLGRNPRMLSSGRHDAAFFTRLWHAVALHGSWQGEIWNRRKNGEVFPEWLTISAVHDAAGRLTHYVATFSDITERKAAEEQIHHLAFYDPLTGLPNRRLMLDRLEAALKDSYRSGQFGALLFIDLDQFKQVNDTLGHHVGDHLLQALAVRLDAVLRDTDTLARLGGDEFAVLLHDLGRDADAVAVVVERIAGKLLGVLQSPVRLDEGALVTTGSIGITLFQDHGVDTDAILQQADMALFQAKAAGRNALRFFDPELQARLQDRARLEADLRQALARDELRLHYQVQVDAAGETTGVEALLRWDHPVRGRVPPGAFIPLAEENRLILPIGDWVLETACRQLVAWAVDSATAGLRVSVNVSPQQFREADFVERVLEIIMRTGAPAERLELEVTESLFVEDRDDARDKILRLRAEGLGFALDDFGTGYSSLAYLKRLPLDRLKIDQSFVLDLLDDPNSAAIVASIISLSASLDLAVVAEGVETRAQKAWLEAHGCQAFQGFLFGRPVPVEALPWMASHVSS
jgi:diguanylate cyclase (GGDEF)-like protein/PAS domain S-box-containing protein